MKIDIHADVHIHMVESGRAPQWAVELQASVHQLKEAIMANFDAITQKITDLESAEDSVIALLTNVVAQLKDAGTDQVKLDDLAAKLEAQKTKLAAAVTANTPAA